MEYIFIKSQFGTTGRMSMYRKIASFLEEGIPLHDILKQLSIQYKKYKKSDIRTKILNEWIASLEAGKSFSSTLSEWVPVGEAMLIKAGEKSGDISSAFQNAILTTESSKKMRSTILGEMSYPVVLLLMLSSLIYLFSTQAVPQLTAVKDPATWPDGAKKLYDMSVFVEHKWWTVILAVFGSAGFASWSMSRMTGKVREYMDKIPPWSIYKTFQSSVFMISVSAMMKTGTPIVESIKELREMSNKYISEHLRLMLMKLNAGKPIGSSMNGGFLDKETGMDIEIYGELSNLQKSMERIGLSAIENSIENIKAAATIFKNLILMGVAGYIGWVYYAFFTLTQSIGTSAGM
jgi:Type II secretory pathway, component PulF